MDVCSLPFNRFVGLVSGKRDGRPVVRLVPQPHHLNHVGTVHASVLSAIAEASAGQAVIERFAETLSISAAVLRSAKTKFRRPAVAEDELTGLGTIDDDVAVAFADTLASRGRALLDISVTIVQHQEAVLRGTFTFFASTTDRAS